MGKSRPLPAPPQPERRRPRRGGSGSTTDSGRPRSPCSLRVWPYLARAAARPDQYFMGEGAPVTSPALSRKAPPSPAARPGDAPREASIPSAPAQTDTALNALRLPRHAPGPPHPLWSTKPQVHATHLHTATRTHHRARHALYKDDNTNKTTGTHHTQRASHQDAQHTHIHTPDASQTHITQRCIHHRPTCTSHTRHPATHAQTHTTHRASPQRPSDISLRGPFTTDTHTYIQTLSLTHMHTHTQYASTETLRRSPWIHKHTPHTAQGHHPSWSQGLPSRCGHGSGEGQAGLSSCPPGPGLAPCG